MALIAFITEGRVVKKILRHLGLPTTCPEPKPARLPKELVFDFDIEGEVSEDPIYGVARSPPEEFGRSSDYDT
jgi:hypothetical protein